jgi:hypothetical protein
VIIRAELRRRGTLVNVEDAGDGFVMFVCCKCFAELVILKSGCFEC